MTNSRWEIDFARRRRKPVAVIGSGVAGLTSARLLVEAGLEVVVYDKGRFPGGRLATRRSRSSEVSFDHGAQYFSARRASFRKEVERWRRAGVAAPWRGRFAAVEDGLVRAAAPTEPVRFVGTPHMNSIAEYLTRDLGIRQRARVASIDGRGPSKWLRLEDGSTVGPFSAVVVTCPAPQAAELLRDVPELRRVTENVRMSPCWCVMATFRVPVRAPFDAATVDGEALAWAARNSSKPGRDTAEAWVLHAAPDWSEQHIDDEPSEVGDALLRAFGELPEVGPMEVDSARAHKWLFAKADPPLYELSLFSPEHGIAVAGDWCGGTRVQGAFLSGADAARRVIEWLQATRSIRRPA